MWHSEKRQNCRCNKEIGDWQGLGEGEMNEHNTEDLQGSETILNDDMCIYIIIHLSRLIECEAQESTSM